jgi:hypothetical protein
MTTTETKEMSPEELEALMETSLDDIEDLPEYADYLPSGAYHLKIVESGWDIIEMAIDKKDDSKGKKEAKIAKVTYEIVNVLELVKPEEAELVKPKMRFQEAYFFTKDPAKTASALKTRYKAVAATFQPPNLVALVDGLSGMEVSCTIKSVKQKDSDKHFINTSNMQPM